MINLNKKLIPLALGTFGLGMSEFVMMGILPDIANSMKVSIPSAGHFISTYAVGVIFGAISMAFLSKNQPLKNLLLGLMIIFTVGNLLTSIATNYGVMNIARFIAGIPHGSFFGISVVAIKQMAQKGHDGRDVAFMVAGFALLFLFFFAKIKLIAVILIFVCSFCLFALSAPQQILIVEVSKGGEVLGSSLAPLAFTLGNAIGAVVGGLPIEHGLGYEFAPLSGVIFAFIGFILLLNFQKRAKI